MDKSNLAIECVNDILSTNTNAHFMIAATPNGHIALQLEDDDDDPIIGDAIADAMLRHPTVEGVILQAMVVYIKNKGGEITIQLPKPLKLN